MKSKTTADRKAQSQRFVEAARELECDEDKERFEEKLGRIARAKPPPAAKGKPVKGAPNASDDPSE